MAAVSNSYLEQKRIWEGYLERKQIEEARKRWQEANEQRERTMKEIRDKNYNLAYEKPPSFQNVTYDFFIKFVYYTVCTGLCGTSTLLFVIGIINISGVEGPPDDIAKGVFIAAGVLAAATLIYTITCCCFCMKNEEEKSLLGINNI